MNNKKFCEALWKIVALLLQLLERQRLHYQQDSQNLSSLSNFGIKSCFYPTYLSIHCLANISFVVGHYGSEDQPPIICSRASRSEFRYLGQNLVPTLEKFCTVNILKCSAKKWTKENKCLEEYKTRKGWERGEKHLNNQCQSCLPDIYRVKQEQRFFSFYLRTTLLHAEIALFSKI